MTLSKFHKVSKNLTADEHVLLRPNMYIGSTSKEKLSQYFFENKKELDYVPGLLKLVYEIIDNSVDIAIKTNFQYGTNIKINIDSTSCSVEDDGTGMAVEMVKDAQGKDIWNPVMSWTKTMAGTNFDETEDRLSMGMNGVGSTVVSIFSKKFVGTTCDGTNKLVVTTIDNNNIDSIKVTKAKKHGTVVYFEPDFERFEIDKFDDNIIEIIKDRLHKIAASYTKLKFTFNGERISYTKTTDIFKKYGENYITETSDDVTIGFFETTEDELQLVSVVNGLNVIKGGSHVDYITDKIVEGLRPLIKKKHKFDVKPAQIKQHLFLNVFIKNFPNMKFDSQTKERITNSSSELEKVLNSIDFSKIVSKMMAKHDLYIMPIVEHQLMKQEQAERRKLLSEQKKEAAKNVSKHVKPIAKSDNIFYIVEGDSAKNNFMPTRSEYPHNGMYPLGGKFLNVYEKKYLDIIAYKPAKEIMSILGLELGKKAPKTFNHGYTKIYLCADADLDGYCINAQMINFFALWPDLFERELVHIVHSPIMEVYKGKNLTQRFYNLNDYRNYTLKTGETIKYIKGLGSMNPDEYKEYLIANPKLDILELDSESETAINIVFGDDPNLRKIWLGKE